MSKIGIRFLAAFGILLGGAAVVLGLEVLGQWLFSSTFGALPPLLPEDLLAGMGYLLLAKLLSWVPALVFSAIVLTFSFWLKPEELPQGSTGPLVRFSVLAVACTVGFAFLSLLAEPWTDAALDDLTFHRTQTLQLEDAYLFLKNRGDEQTAADFETRMSLLKRLGQLRPDQGQLNGAGERMDYDFELQILKAHFELNDFFQLRALPGTREAALDTRATVEDLLTEAEAALANPSGDQEFQANLWGFQAYRRLLNAADQGTPVDAKLMERAKLVVDTSWGRTYEKTLAADERKKASYFFRKGKSLGDFQFQNFLEAYYGFQELNRENPQDQEVAQHMALALEKIQDQVLFSQEMEVLFHVPGSDNLVFVNRESPTEVVRIGKLLNTSQGVFVKDFEFLRFDHQGSVLLHWTAPYGRWTGAGLDFRVWDKETPKPQFPVVLAETPGNEFNPQQTVDPPVFVPSMSVRDLEAVNADDPRPQTVGTWDLLVHGRSIEALGYNSRLFQTEFLTRLAAPFGFFVVYLFVFALAWRNRAHVGGRSWWFLFPVLPLVVEFLVQTAQWASRLAVGGLLLSVGFETTVAVLSVAFLAFSVWGVVQVQRQFRRSLS